MLLVDLQQLHSMHAQDQMQILYSWPCRPGERWNESGACCHGVCTAQEVSVAGVARVV